MVSFPPISAGQLALADQFISYRIPRIVVLSVGDGPNARLCWAKGLILYVQSSFFAKTLLAMVKNDKRTRTTVTLYFPTLNFQAVCDIIGFLSSGIMPFSLFPECPDFHYYYTNVLIQAAETFELGWLVKKLRGLEFSSTFQVARGKSRYMAPVPIPAKKRKFEDEENTDEN